MKKIFLVLLAVVCMGAGMSAQVQVKVNSGTPYALDTTGGIYFVGDTMTVHSAVDETLTLPLEQVSVVTFQVQSQEGIQAATQSSLSIAPVPARDHVVLHGIGNTPREVVLYNAAGQQLLKKQMADGGSMDLKHLPAGSYVLRCGEQVKKIIKK